MNVQKLFELASRMDKVGMTVTRVGLIVEKAIRRAKDNDIPVIYIQHVVKQEPAPFFGEETPGVKINSRILAAAPDAPIIVKQNADSFQGTKLEEVLNKLDVTELLVCGMMTHNCVSRHWRSSRNSFKTTAL